MKKVSMLHYAYPPHIGSVENLMHEHALVLADLGYGVKVLTGAGKEVRSQIEFVVDPKLQSIQVFDPSMQEKLLGRGEIDEDFYALAARIEADIEQELSDSDTVIVHNMMSHNKNLAFTFAFKKYAQNHPEKQYIIWVHDHVYISEERIKQNLKEIYHTDFVNELLTQPIPGARYVVVSEVFKKMFLEVMKVDPSVVSVIPAGVDIKSFIGASDILWSWCKSKEVLDHFPIFFSPTNILPRKNLEYTLYVVAEIKKIYPNLMYIISGKTTSDQDTKDYRLKLQQRIEELGLRENVVFLAEDIELGVDYDDVKALYRLSDGVLYLSKSENFGIPILESAIFKTHIFASNLQVFKEIAKEHVIEYIDFNNVTSADAAKRILENIDQSKLIKLTGDIRQNYNLHKVLEKHLIPLLNVR